MATSSEVTLSTYIVGRINYSTSETSTGHNVSATWQCRRTNSYSGATFQYPSSSYITIAGNNQSWSWSSTDYPSIPGNNTNWINFCNRTYHVAHTSATTITISAGNQSMGSYLTGSVSCNVTLGSIGPTYTAPSTPSVSISKSTSSATVSYSTSSFGNPSTGTLYLYGTGSSSTSTVTSTSSRSSTYYFYPSYAGTYYFRARAYNGQLWSSYSNEASVSFSATAPSSASVSGTVVSQTQINLNFSGSGGAFSSNTLYLYGGESTSNMQQLKSISSSSSSYSHTGLKAGTLYYYYAKYTNSIGSAQSSTVSYRTRYAPPNFVTATSLQSQEDGKGVSTVTVGSWGENSTMSKFAILNSGRTQLTSSTATGDTSQPMTWTIPTSNTNTNTCAINTWYGRATNSHDEYADSGAYYLATPTAPSVTFYGHTGTAPYLTRTNTVMYAGGATNSATADTSTLRQWTFYHTRLSDNVSSTPTVRLSAAKMESIDHTMEEFTTGSNYTFTTKVSNVLGGVGITTSKTYYCPGGVGGSPTMITPDQVELKGSYTSPGGNGDTTSGAIACYQMKWGKSATDLNNSTKIQVSPYFDLIDLEPGVTYYYQIIAWNTYGLSGQSPILNFTTGGRYLPSASDFEVRPGHPGADIEIDVGRSGGVTPDELGIQRITVEVCPEGTEEWELIAEQEGLDLHGGDKYVFKSAWEGYLPEPGNYEMKVTLYNEYDSNRKIFLLIAPTILEVSPKADSTKPTQITLNARITAGTGMVNIVDIKLEGASLEVSKTDEVSIPSGETATSTIISPNYLLFDTTYVANVTAKDDIGLWQTTRNGVNIKTPARVTYHYVTETKTQAGSASYRNSGILRSVGNAYYVVANALGNLTVGASMNKKRLTFIPQPLFYRPESVASMELSDGSRISFEYNEKVDMYQFGIWKGNNIETVFFDGEEWKTDHYDFGTNSLTVTSLKPNGKGMNASSAFSTTVIKETV